MTETMTFQCSEQRGDEVLEIASWPANYDRLKNLAASWKSAGHRVLHVAPGRYWVLGAALPMQDEKSDGIAMVNLSDALLRFRLEGTAVRNVLRKGLAIDLHPRVFNDGDMATSMLEGITVTLVRQGDAFDLYCRLSYAGSIRHWIDDAALEFTGAG